MANVAFDISWIKAMLDEIYVPISTAPILWYDNLGVVYLAFNLVLHSKIKHIDLDVHFIRERVLAKGLLCS